MSHRGKLTVMMLVPTSGVGGGSGKVESREWFAALTSTFFSSGSSPPVFFYSFCNLQVNLLEEWGGVCKEKFFSCFLSVTVYNESFEISSRRYFVLMEIGRWNSFIFSSIFPWKMKLVCSEGWLFCMATLFQVERNYGLFKIIILKQNIRPNY